MGLITLLTDFGHKDSYVGVMKGVIAGIGPHNQVIDLTHDIQPQSILGARFNLLASYSYFPAKTIHIVVVDPGVGTQRVAIAAQVSTPRGHQTVVVPDNGILTGFCITAAVALTQTDYWLTSQPSNTFHGRDIFAPVAAHLANGVPMEKLGPSISAADLVCLDIGTATSTPIGYDGSIQYSDHFGNLITNIPGQNLRSRPWQVILGEHRLPYYRTYGQTEPGTALALIGSHGYVELAINGGSAAQILATQIGDPVKLIYES
ncbi:MAG: SAM-dependent chlorinase/fluorinase [Leptolyngbyaceae cyanobacterium MAG.088]|nr:SAM-dependent chlorinase/fluorinase [Leptolyngbyaceae cyanobacterium MAG.088]